MGYKYDEGCMYEPGWVRVRSVADQFSRANNDEAQDESGYVMWHDGLAFINHGGVLTGWAFLREIDNSGGSPPCDLTTSSGASTRFCLAPKAINLEGDDHDSVIEAISHEEAAKWRKENGVEERFGRYMELGGFDGASPPFYRLRGDIKAHYGDGGYTHWQYPVWVAPSLELREGHRVKMVNNLRILAESRQDKHENEPVEDIIDPDLSPMLIHSPEQPNTPELAEALTKRLVESGKNIPKDGPYHSAWHRQNRGRRGGEHYPSDGTSLRETYQWIPTEIRVGPDFEVRFGGPIHNLPTTPETKPLYQSIARVFQAMLPLFEQLQVVKRGTPAKLQVIVKSQRYTLAPRQSYAGKWHVEGQTENIVAAGVYYCYCGKGTEGGSLKFRPPESPDPCYVQYESMDETVDVRTNTAIAFSNVMPHRFRRLTNYSEEPVERMFVNFFIVNPDKPIVHRGFLTTSDNILALSTIWTPIRKNRAGLIPPELMQIVARYCGPMWPTLAKAKEFRERARQAMKETITGWGWICWGNCGDVNWVPDYEISYICDLRSDTVRHTLSGSAKSDHMFPNITNTDPSAPRERGKKVVSCKAIQELGLSN